MLTAPQAGHGQCRPLRPPRGQRTSGSRGAREPRPRSYWGWTWWPGPARLEVVHQELTGNFNIPDPSRVGQLLGRTVRRQKRPGTCTVFGL